MDVFQTMSLHLTIAVLCRNVGKNVSVKVCEAPLTMLQKICFSNCNKRGFYNMLTQGVK